MIVYRATRYRIYPTAAQASVLSGWQVSLRWLWNLAHEQRLAGLSRGRVFAPTTCRACGASPRPDDGAENAWTCGCGERLPRASTAKGAVDERVFVRYLDQQAQLTELRALLPWLADVPCCVCQGILRDLDKAWDRCFKGLSGRPRFKGKHDQPPSLFASAPRFCVEASAVSFPKLGIVRAIVHRPPPGALKTVRIQRDVDQWFAVVMCEVEIADASPHPGPAVGLDRGVVNLLADSDGRVVANKFRRAPEAAAASLSRHSGGGAACGGSGSGRPTKQEEPVARPVPSHMAPEGDLRAGEEAGAARLRCGVVAGDLRAGEEAFRRRCVDVEARGGTRAGEDAGSTRRGTSRIAGTTRAGEDARKAANPAARVLRAERNIARKVEVAKAEGRRRDGANLRKALERLAKLQRKVRRQRDHLLHAESKRYAERHGTIVLEKLTTKAMTASAKGTAEEPGRNVRAKAGLNRGIASAGWAKFATMVRYKSEERGGRVVEVPAAYTSQTCSACGHVAAESRPTQATFACVSCGHAEHADVNAAKVILARGLAGQVVPPKAPKKTLRVMKRARKSSAPTTPTAAVPAVEACGGDRQVVRPVEAGSQAGDGSGLAPVRDGETSEAAA